MITRLRIDPQINNECDICGGRPTTAEGLLCRRHWDMADGDKKQRYQEARKAIIEDVFAKEILK